MSDQPLLDYRCRHVDGDEGQIHRIRYESYVVVLCEQCYRKYQNGGRVLTTFDGWAEVVHYDENWLYM